jgi:tetratricopeptide (TPR) repeat protein
MKGVIQNVLLFIFLTIVCSQLSAQSKGWAKINKMSGMAQVDDNYNSDPERFKNAIEYFNDCLKYFPRDYEALEYRGRAKMGLGNYAAAIIDFTKAIDAKSDHILVDAIFNRGICKTEIGQYKGALKDFDLVFEYHSNPSKIIYTFIGKCNFHLGDIKQAKDNVDFSISNYPRVNDNYHTRGLIRLKEKDLVGACEDFTKAKELGYKKSLEKEMAAACK